MEKKTLTEEERLIREAKSAYMREWRKRNRKKTNANAKKWRDENPEKVAEANRKYWLKKAEKQKRKAN